MNGKKGKRIRRITLIILFVLGIALVATALLAEILGIGNTPGFGVVQLFQLLLGVTLLTIAGFWHAFSLRPVDAPRSLQADIAIRIAATGLVFSYVSAFADVLTIGTHLSPRFERPFVGNIQLAGILLGIISTIVGLIMLHTSRGMKKSSSLEFLIKPENGEQKESL